MGNVVMTVREMIRAIMEQAHTMDDEVEIIINGEPIRFMVFGRIPATHKLF